jgi:hypothetical protein
MLPTKYFISREELHRYTIDRIAKNTHNPISKIILHLQTKPNDLLFGGYILRSSGDKGQILFMGYSQDKWQREIEIWKQYISYSDNSEKLLVVGSKDKHHTLPRIFSSLNQKNIVFIGFQDTDSEILSIIKKIKKPVKIIGYVSAIERIRQ